jgi:hypothetical protein
VSSNNDWLSPSWHTSWNVFDDDGLTEDDTTNDVANSAVGGLPHLLKIELFDSGLVRSNGCTLYANLASFYSFCGVDRDLVICGITVLNT